MTIASRLYASLAAFALVLAGMTALVPSVAQAQSRVTTGALIAGALVTTTVVTALVLLNNDDNDDEGPQSP